MKTIKLKSEKDISVRKFLKDKDFSSRSIREILDEGYLLNGKKKVGNFKLKQSDELEILVEDENLDYEAIKGPLEIIYQDYDILVVNKKAGITVNSKNQISLANHIAYYFKENDIHAKIRLVNRLDMNTSGLLMVARNKYAFAHYQKEIEEDRFTKKYLAKVSGRLQIDNLIKVKLAYNDENKNYEVSDEGKEAITYFKTLSYDPDENTTKVVCNIKTGKTHQIRASLSHLGYPIVGDRLYGSEIKMERFLLHAYYIKFNKFLSNEVIELHSNPPF